MRKINALGHSGQILTTRMIIIDTLQMESVPITYYTILLIAEYIGGIKHDLRLYGVCAKLYYLSRLVYWGKDGVCKLTPEKYRKVIFDHNVESLPEAYNVLISVDSKYKTYKSEKNELFFKQLWDCFVLIRDFWCENLACLYEQVYIPELAYAFDYITAREGNLPHPVFENLAVNLFPSNYEKYNYCEGIADRFNGEMLGLF